MALSSVAAGSVARTLGLLTLLGEPSLRRARLAKLTFEMADPAAQELPLLRYTRHLTLGLRERASGLVHCYLGCLRGLGRSLCLTPG